MGDEADRVAKATRLCCALPSFLTDSCSYVPAAEGNKHSDIRVVTDAQSEPAPPPAGTAQMVGQPATTSKGAANAGGNDGELSSFLNSAIAQRHGAAEPDAQNKNPRASPTRTSPSRGRSNSPHRPRSPRSVNISMLVGELRTEAARLVAEGHPEAAELVYKEALRYNPSDFVLKASQIECLLLQGRAQEALNEAQTVTSLAPHVAKGWMVEAGALEKLGQLQPALERFRKAVLVAQSDGSDPALVQHCMSAAEAVQMRLGPA